MNGKQEGEDEVICEFDVHFAPKRKGDLHLFQFCHNASPFSGKKNLLGEIKVKPKLNQFEIELLLDMRCKYFDKSKGEKIAYMVDKQKMEINEINSKNEGEIFFTDEIMNKQILNSEQMNSTYFSYALGYLRKDLNNLQLIPIKSLLDFKPTFRYLDKASIRTNSKLKDELLDEEELIDNSQETETPKKVTMRFEDNKADENKNKKEKVTTIENWKNLKYFDYDQPKFENEKQMIIYNVCEANENEDVSNKLPHNNENLFSYKKLANTFLNDEKCNRALNNNLVANVFNSISIYKLRDFDLKDQVRIILCNAKILPFKKFISLLSSTLVKGDGKMNNTVLDLDSILKYLQQVALLVQGNWVVKSEIIYPKPLNTNAYDLNSIPFTNISIDMLCKARDFILYNFTKKLSISRQELIKSIKIPPENITDVLKQFSVFNQKTKCWDFFYAKDESFLKEYNEIAQRQTMLWEAQSTFLYKIFN